MSTAFRIIPALLIFAMASCSQPEEKSTGSEAADIPAVAVQETSAAPAPVTASMEVKTFSNSANSSEGFGYDILMDGRLYIHQPHIPAIPGNIAFTTEEQARRAGELVLFKLRNNIMPPSISVEELDSLKIVH